MKISSLYCSLLGGMVISLHSSVVIDQKYLFAFFVRISFEQENFKLPPSLPPDFRKVWLFQQISPVWGSHLELLPLLWNHKLHKPKTFDRASRTNFGPAPSHQTFSKYGNVPSCTISAKNCTKPPKPQPKWCFISFFCFYLLRPQIIFAEIMPHIIF